MDSDLPRWLMQALVFTVAPALAAGILVIVETGLVRILKSRRAPLLCRVIRAGSLPLRIAAALLAVLAVLPEADLSTAAEASVRRALQITLIAAFGWALARKVGAIFDSMLSHTVQPGEDWLARSRRRTQLVVFRRLAVSAIVLLTAGLVLTAIPAVRAVGLSVFASAGVAGIVAGIAARPAVSNLIAGLQIAITQPIRIGDAVVVEGEWGHVEEISSTYVTITTWDQRNLVVPLSYFLEKPIRNWTKNSTQLLDTVFVYADYGVPIDAIREKVKQVLDATPLWDRRAWAVQVTDLKDNAMEIRVLMSADDAGRMFDLRCLMREELVRFLTHDHPQGLPRARVEMEQGKSMAFARG